MNNSAKLYVRSNIDINESIHWDLYAPYALFKNEYIDKESEKGIILSYVNAVNILCKEIKSQNHGGVGVVAVFRVNTLTIPFMFLVRHTMELIIKYIRKGCNLQVIPNHHLDKLWNDVIPIIKKMNCGFDDKILDGITEFINEISFVDNDGTKTRYSHDNQGNIQNREPVFINCENINTFIQAFSKIAAINFEELKDESTNKTTN